MKRDIIEQRGVRGESEDMDEEGMLNVVLCLMYSMYVLYAVLIALCSKQKIKRGECSFQ